MSAKEDLDAIEPADEATNDTVTTPSSSSENWWSPWLEAAKSKSTEVFEFVKKDLNEISTVVKSEANAVVSSTAAVIKDTLKLDEPESTASSMKKSMSSFLVSVGNALSPAADDEGEEAILIQDDRPVPLSRFQSRLYALIKAQETFTTPIEEDVLSQFESWLSVADEQLTRERLTKLLMASPDLHNQYEALVPEKVNHLEFWQRYLFRKALLEDEESLREAREKKEQALADKLQWDRENFAEGIDLTEEEQMKILADYEDERKMKDSTDGQLLQAKTLTENIRNAESAFSSTKSSIQTSGEDSKNASKELISKEKQPPARKDVAESTGAVTKSPSKVSNPEIGKTKNVSPSKKASVSSAAGAKKAIDKDSHKDKVAAVASDNDRASSSSGDSKDTDDWEKDFDLDDDVPDK